MADPTQEQQRRFDAIKQVNPYGQAYWSARNLMPLLGYDQWRRFEDSIERAKAACANVGETVEDHFAAAGKMVPLGSGAQREIAEYYLSRTACYFVAMNGDPRKPEIAAAQAYFIVQTRRTEIWDELRHQVAERVEQREQLAEANKQLNATAKAHGLNTRSFGLLHDAGTRGLYGGLGVDDVKARKGIGAQEDHADRMGSAELIANAFVRSQTQQKIDNTPIHGTASIIAAHREVGTETRGVIERTGGTLPEDLPAEASIRPALEQRARAQESAHIAERPVAVRRACTWKRANASQRRRLRSRLGLCSRRQGAHFGHGVNMRSCGLLHDVGARGLYGGISLGDEEEYTMSDKPKLSQAIDLVDDLKTSHLTALHDIQRSFLPEKAAAYLSTLSRETYEMLDEIRRLLNQSIDEQYQASTKQWGEVTRAVVETVLKPERGEPD